jgi:uncharacterized protein (DUF934 family)
MQPERVIRNRKVENDTWHFVGLPQSAPSPRGPSGAGLNTEGWGEGAVVVPLAVWKEHRETLLARATPIGVWLKPDDDPGAIADDLHRLTIVAVHFPKFTDGRGYSTAALLRTRYAYRGELRAFGDVGRDQLFYLARCGFDSFRLADHRDPEAALASFNDFTVRYQGSVDDPAPLFRKRLTMPGGAVR